MKAVARALALGSLGLLAACATNRAPEARVTRFHLGQPIAPAQIAVEPLNPAAGQSLEYGVFEGAVTRELTRLGFTPAPALTKSEMVAVVSVNRNFRPGGRGGNGSGVSIGLGGGGFSGGRRGGGFGLGGGVSFPVGGRGGRGGEVAATDLSVQLKRRSDGTVIWEGRAQSEVSSKSPAASPAATAQQLATALFQGFPGESGRTVVVK